MHFTQMCFTQVGFTQMHLTQMHFTQFCFMLLCYKHLGPMRGLRPNSMICLVLPKMGLIFFSWFGTDRYIDIRTLWLIEQIGIGEDMLKHGVHNFSILAIRSLISPCGSGSRSMAQTTPGHCNLFTDSAEDKFYENTQFTEDNLSSLLGIRYIDNRHCVAWAVLQKKLLYWSIN